MFISFLKHLKVDKYWVTKLLQEMASYNNNNNLDDYSSSSSSDEQMGYPVDFLDKSFQCVICQLTIRRFTELPCGHAGCKICIEKWEKTSMQVI